jgi:deazaflavin-dependent oxidoreductase (nitroreductase family)
MAISQFANERGIYLGRRASRLHVALYRLTGGRLGGHHPGLPGARIALVDHVGAKSGRRRTSPIMFHQEGRVVAVAASKAGEPSNPAWFHNLRAHPETTIQIGSEVRRVRARVATDEERELLWPRFMAFYPGYDFLQRRAGARRIPIVILEPRDLPLPPSSPGAVIRNLCSSSEAAIPDLTRTRIGPFARRVWPVR